MAEITLIASAQARTGFEFVYLGGAPVCRACPYRQACLTLDAGRKYRVERVRSVQHPCALQETSAHVVEVVPVARRAVVEARAAIQESTVEIGRYPCQRLDCPNWSDCAGPSLPPRQRFRVQKVEPELAECRIGRTLKGVEVV